MNWEVVGSPSHTRIQSPCSFKGHYGTTNTSLFSLKHIKILITFKGAIELGENPRVFDEFGAVMLNIIKLSLVLQINAENSLTNATNKFINRFIDVLHPMEGNGSNLYAITSTEQDALWRN